MDELKAIIRSLAISSASGMTLSQLDNDFKSLEGYSIPYHTHGFKSLHAMLQTLTDVVLVNGSTIHPVTTEKNQHIRSLVEKSKKKKKTTSYSRPARSLRQKPLVPKSKSSSNPIPCYISSSTNEKQNANRKSARKASSQNYCSEENYYFELFMQNLNGMLGGGKGQKGQYNWMEYVNNKESNNFHHQTSNMAYWNNQQSWNQQYKNQQNCNQQYNNQQNFNQQCSNQQNCNQQYSNQQNCNQQYNNQHYSNQQNCNQQNCSQQYNNQQNFSQQYNNQQNCNQQYNNQQNCNQQYNNQQNCNQQYYQNYMQQSTGWNYNQQVAHQPRNMNYHPGNNAYCNGFFSPNWGRNNNMPYNNSMGYNNAGWYPNQWNNGMGNSMNYGFNNNYPAYPVNNGSNNYNMSNWCNGYGQYKY